MDATPTTVRESPQGAIAVRANAYWLVVRSGGANYVTQRLIARDVAGWQVLFNHHESS